MIDAYLQIDGIKGESTDDKHKDWIEASHVLWGVPQPRAATVSTAGGHTSGRAELRNIAFQKLADLSSPALLQTCAAGKTERFPYSVDRFQPGGGPRIHMAVPTNTADSHASRSRVHFLRLQKVARMPEVDFSAVRQIKERPPAPAARGARSTKVQGPLVTKLGHWHHQSILPS
jgi:hypothetical protein